QQKETSVVFATIFEMLAQDDAAITLDGAPAGNGRSSRIIRLNNLGDAAGCIIRRHATYLRIDLKETSTLLERDGMRFHRLNRVKRSSGAANQVMADRNDDFADDLQIAIGKHVEGSMHETNQAVLNRSQNVVCRLIVDGAE